MNKLILTGLSALLLAMPNMRLCGQNFRSIDFIIEINEDIAISSIARPRIISRAETIEVEYHPGNLSLKQSDYDKLKEMEADSMVLVFDHYEYKGKKQILCNYELPFFSTWFESTYIVIKIYNLDKKKYRDVFEPLDENRNYTFEIHSSEGSMLRVRKKAKKKSD